jgi:hypothetical protein
MSDERRFWQVRIAFYKDYGFERPTYSETSTHVGFECAPTALDAIRLCAEWREAPPPSDWCEIECTLRATGDYDYVSKRPWDPNWETK